MKKFLSIGTELVEVEFTEQDFKEDYFKHIPDVDPTYLIRYDEEKDIAIVDTNAPQWYKELAALHETICCGGKYEDLVPGLTSVAPEERCSRIERFVLLNAGENRQAYILARIDMFRMLLDKKLCDDKFRPNIKHTLDVLILNL